MAKEQNINWSGLTRAIRRRIGYGTLDAVQTTMQICKSDSLTTNIGTLETPEWRMRRYYDGDLITWVDVRQRRNGGLIMCFNKIEPKLPVNADRSGVEILASEAMPVFGETQFDQAFKAMTRCSYEEWLDRYTGDEDASRKIKKEKIAAPMLSREEIMPDWGTW